MYSEDDMLMLSGIQHFKFCRRQWALIHIEQQWSENVHTVIGELMHKNVHDPSVKEKRKETYFLGMPLSVKIIPAFIQSSQPSILFVSRNYFRH